MITGVFHLLCTGPLSEYFLSLHEVHQIYMLNPIPLLKKVVRCDDILRVVIPNPLPVSYLLVSGSSYHNEVLYAC